METLKTLAMLMLALLLSDSALFAAATGSVFASFIERAQAFEHSAPYDACAQAMRIANILGASSSEKNDITTAYRTLAHRFHPDKNPGNKTEAELAFKALGQLYSRYNDLYSKTGGTCGTPGAVVLSPGDVEVGRTQWHVAAINNNLKAIESLIAKNAPGINAQDQLGDTPICLAGMWGHIDIFNLLVAKGANINIGDCLNKLITEYFMSKGYPENRRAIFDRLLELGADVNNVDEFESTPLDQAFLWTNCDMHIINGLLKKGARVNIEQGPGTTFLHLAVFNKCSDAIKALLEHGADPHMQDKKGKTPLDYALENGTDVYFFTCPFASESQKEVTCKKA